MFHDLSGVSYDEAIGDIGKVLRAKDKVQEVRLARELADVFRLRYERAYRLAVAGESADE